MRLLSYIAIYKKLPNYSKVTKSFCIFTRNCSVSLLALDRDLKNFSRSVGVWWYLTLIFIFISLMIKNAEDFFMCFVAIYIISRLKYSFKPFAFIYFTLLFCTWVVSLLFFNFESSLLFWAQALCYVCVLQILYPSLWIAFSFY